MPTESKSRANREQPRATESKSRALLCRTLKSNSGTSKSNSGTSKRTSDVMEKREQIESKPRATESKSRATKSNMIHHFYLCWWYMIFYHAASHNINIMGYCWILGAWNLGIAMGSSAKVLFQVPSARTLLSGAFGLVGMYIIYVYNIYIYICVYL